MPLAIFHSGFRCATALAAAGGLAALAGCANSFLSSAFEAVTPYKVEIVQGNVITAEQVARVKPGMTRDEVRGVLGAPLLTDAFHSNRWDYHFTLRRDGQVQQRRQVVAWFENDKLKKLDAPSDLPDEQAFVASMTKSRRASGEPTKLELSDDERRALPLPEKAVAPAAAASAPARTYPPLEGTK